MKLLVSLMMIFVLVVTSVFAVTKFNLHDHVIKVALEYFFIWGGRDLDKIVNYSRDDKEPAIRYAFNLLIWAGNLYNEDVPQNMSYEEYKEKARKDLLNPEAVIATYDKHRQEIIRGLRFIGLDKWTHERLKEALIFFEKPSKKVLGLYFRQRSERLIYSKVVSRLLGEFEALHRGFPLTPSEHDVQQKKFLAEEGIEDHKKDLQKAKDDYSRKFKEVYGTKPISELEYYLAWSMRRYNEGGKALTDAWADVIRKAIEDLGPKSDISDEGDFPGKKRLIESKARFERVKNKE